MIAKANKKVVKRALTATSHIIINKYIMHWANTFHVKMRNITIMMVYERMMKEQKMKLLFHLGMIHFETALSNLYVVCIRR